MSAHAYVASHIGKHPLPGQNPGLVLQKLATVTNGGKDYDPVIQAMAGAEVAVAYTQAFQRWQRRTLEAPWRKVMRFRSEAPVACGLGEAFPGENGLALSHPWGMPLLPGSSLKGVVRAWCRMVYGAEVPKDLLDLTGTGGHAGAAGIVDFLDAWVDPTDAGAPPRFVAELATPHQAAYYKEGGTAGRARAPDGFDGPNPVKFLSVSGTFRVVLEGPPDWLELAAQVVQRALSEHGLGAKTRAGYGRLQRIPDTNEQGLETQRDRDREEAAIPTWPAARRVERFQAELREDEVADGLEALMLGRDNLSTRVRARLERYRLTGEEPELRALGLRALADRAPRRFKADDGAWTTAWLAWGGEAPARGNFGAATWTRPLTPGMARYIPDELLKQRYRAEDVRRLLDHYRAHGLPEGNLAKVKKFYDLP